MAGTLCKIARNNPGSGRGYTPGRRGCKKRMAPPRQVFPGRPSWPLPHRPGCCHTRRGRYRPRYEKQFCLLPPPFCQYRVLPFPGCNDRAVYQPGRAMVAAFAPIGPVLQAMAYLYKLVNDFLRVLHWVCVLNNRLPCLITFAAILGKNRERKPFVVQLIDNLFLFRHAPGL